MRQDRSNDKVVENYDLLAPAGFGEIIGGSVREDDYDRLIARMAEEKLSPENYSWYWTSASTAHSRTAASAWVWRGPWPGSQARSTSASASPSSDDG